MYLRQDEADRLLQTHLAELVSSLRGHHSFLEELQGGDDWAFVIKAQALIEGAVTQAILAQIGDGRIKKTIEVMQLVGEEVSKLALAKDFGLFTAEQRRFIKRMASLRNRLAHRVENASFTFSEYVASLNRDSLRDWQESIIWFTDTSKSRKVWASIAATQPRAAIYLGTFLLVALLTIEGSEKDVLRKIDATAETTTKELLEILASLKSV